MKYILLLTILFCCNVLGVNAQIRPSIVWSKTFGGSKIDKANDILIHPDGSLVLVGLTHSNDSNVTGHHGSLDSADAWVIKLNTDGDLLWQKSVGGSNTDYLTSIIPTHDGGFLCTGYTNSNDGDISGSRGGGDLWLLKMNHAGDVLWSKCYGGSGYDAGSQAVALQGGGFAVVGTSASFDGQVVSGTPNRNHTDAWVIKIDNDGNLMWEKCIDPQLPSTFTKHDVGYSILEMPDLSLQVLISATDTYQLFVSPTFQPARCTPGLLYSMSVTDGAFTLLGNIGGDKNFSMVRTPGVTHMATEQYRGRGSPWNSPESYCYYTKKSDTSSNFLRTTYSYMDWYNSGYEYEYIAERNGLAAHDGFIAGAGTKYIDGTWGGEYGYLFLGSPTRKYYYGQENGWPIRESSAFNSIKITTSGDFIVAGSSTVENGFSPAYNGDIPFGNGAHDFWVMRLSPLNRIIGQLYLDENSNGIRDPGEMHFDNAQVKVFKNGFAESLLPMDGMYQTFVDTGNYTVLAQLNNPYYTVAPASHSVSFSSYNNADTVDFAVSIIPNIHDCALYTSVVTAMRPGFDASFKLEYLNKGTVDEVDKEIIFVMDYRSSFNTASITPSSFSGDTIKWIIPNLAVGESGTIDLTLQLSPPPMLNIADTLYVQSIIDSVADLAPADNYNIIRILVTGAYDPNDKQENFGGIISLPELTQGKFLNYTIRFQNTGNDTAFTIVIRDTLSNLLNPDSLYITATSHPAIVKIIDGNILVATFNNIRLVDSVRNEPESHGFISFRIKPLPGLQVGDTVSNRASIYFDYNPPIVTNDVHTIVTENFTPPPPPAPIFELVSFSAAEENNQVRISWQTMNENDILEYIVEFGTDGINFQNLNAHVPLAGTGLNQYSTLHPNPVVGYNFYRLKITKNNSLISYSAIKEVILDDVTPNPSAVPLSIYPNPANDFITLHMQLEQSVIAGIKVIDAKGRTVYRRNISLQQGMNNHIIPCSNWPTGMYWVKLIDGSKIRVVSFLKN